MWCPTSDNRPLHGHIPSAFVYLAAVPECHYDDQEDVIGTGLDDAGNHRPEPRTDGASRSGRKIPTPAP